MPPNTAGENWISANKVTESLAKHSLEQTTLSMIAVEVSEPSHQPFQILNNIVILAQNSFTTSTVLNVTQTSSGILTYHVSITVYGHP